MKWTHTKLFNLVLYFEPLTIQELALKLGCTDSAVRRRARDLGLKKSASALALLRLRNDGTFKPGQIPVNALRDKKVTIRNDKGRLEKWIRLSAGEWEPLKLYLWRSVGKDIPEGYCLSYKDGDSLNCVLSNLELITRAENLKRNKKHQQTYQSTKAKRKDAERKRKEILKEQKKKQAAAERERKRLEEQLRKESLKEVKPVTFKPVDLSNKIPLRIDAKTVVYIRPGQDPEKVKLKYQR
ncbi:HNH endonuclease [Pedobacter sp. BS3]|uniref:HNH endonuclease n=1 Tax=Pedobacter sp. BS3 TaxID=2567937 RepID=UPI0018D5C787|nr:HNH endonuclease [Pedobacter sp. BS3]